jgi:hypothetical protein
VQQFVAGAAKIGTLECPSECAAELIVERAKCGGQFGAGRQQHAEERGVDVGRVAVA